MDDSDDKIFVTDDAVIMLDGASAFAPVPVSVSAYAGHLGGKIRDQLTERPGIDLTEALRAGISSTADELALTPGESPSSTVTIARWLGDHLDLLVLGDNLAVLPEAVITDDRLDVLDLEPRREYQQRLIAGAGYDKKHFATLRELQNQQAGQRNREGGYWIAEADPNAAAHAITVRRHLDAVPWVVLATDGVYNPMSLHKYHDWSRYAGYDDRQLANLLEQLRHWEANVDPNGQQLPRAKRHDDKSIAGIRFAP
jgi:hypothetical protein